MVLPPQATDPGPKAQEARAPEQTPVTHLLGTTLTLTLGQSWHQPGRGCGHGTQTSVSPKPTPSCQGGRTRNH